MSVLVSAPDHTAQPGLGVPPAMSSAEGDNLEISHSQVSAQ